MTESEYSGPARHSPAADNVPEPTRVADEPQPPHAQTESPVDGTITGVGSETDNVDEDESPQVVELRRLTSCFPMEKNDIQKLSEIIQRCSAEELTRLGLGPPPRPRVPRNLDKMPVQQRIKTIQGIISAFQYNHTPSNYFNVNKDRPFCRIMDTARDIQRDALPIKCIEGAILGLFFTCGHEDLDRMALRFKTTAGGNIYRHIVLAIRHRPSANWGAVGLSRREELMYKEMGYDSLAALVTDYIESYGKWFHKVLKVRVGLPAEHNLFYSGRINWCHTILKPQEKEWSHWCGLLDNHTAEMRKALDYWRQMGAEAQKQGKDGPMWTAYRRSAVFDNKAPKPKKGQRRRVPGEPYLASPTANKGAASKAGKSKGGDKRKSTGGGNGKKRRDSDDAAIGGAKSDALAEGDSTAATSSSRVERSTDGRRAESDNDAAGDLPATTKVGEEAVSATTGEEGSGTTSADSDDSDDSGAEEEEELPHQ